MPRSLVALSLLLCCISGDLIAGGESPLVPGGVPDPIAPERTKLRSVSGCENHYTVYRPSGPADGPVVLIVPGFMRDQHRMRGWAQEIARRGLTAATMDFCQPTAFDGRHAENARDMIAVRAQLGAQQVVYLGHSAGGLAALLAAADDPAARGMVLLDPVDFAGLAREAARRIRVPGVALLAEPGTCNLRRNIQPALESMPLVTTIPVAAVTHCDFEWPPDALCRAFCDFGGPGRDQRIASEQRIRTLVIDFIESWRDSATGHTSPEPHHQGSIDGLRSSP
jgi:dienelactone hydrolase